jgi:hypothetical protein
MLLSWPWYEPPRWQARAIPASRQWLPKKLNPRGELSVPELRDLLRQHMLAYRVLVLLDNVEPGMMVKKAFAIYRKCM